MPLLLPESVAQDDPPGLQLSTACRTVVVSVAARDDLLSHHRRLGLLVRHPPHALHLALSQLDEQVASTAIDEVRGRPHDQPQRNEPHRRGGDHRCSELDGWLAGERDGLPRVER